MNEIEKCSYLCHKWHEFNNDHNSAGECPNALKTEIWGNFLDGTTLKICMQSEFYT